jgi:type IV pilus assembly protein PilO
MQIRELIIQLWRAQRVMLIVIAALIVINLGLYLSLEQLLVPKVAAMENWSIQRQKEVRQLQRNKGGLANTPEQLFVLASQDLAEFRKAVPLYLDFTALIEELLVLSSRAGLNITQISYDPEQVKGDNLLRYKLVFNVSGNYDQIKKFIYSLEQSTRLLVINDISLQSVEGGAVNLRLNMETFFRQERADS